MPPEYPDRQGGLRGANGFPRPHAPSPVDIARRMW